MQIARPLFFRTSPLLLRNILELKSRVFLRRVMAVAARQLLPPNSIFENGSIRLSHSDSNTNTLFGADADTNPLRNINTSTGTVVGSFSFLDVQGLAVHSAAVPEPSSLVMMCVGLCGMGVTRCRRHRRNTKPATENWYSACRPDLR